MDFATSTLHDFLYFTSNLWAKDEDLCDYLKVKKCGLSLKDYKNSTSKELVKRHVDDHDYYSLAELDCIESATADEFLRIKYHNSFPHYSRELVERIIEKWEEMKSEELGFTVKLHEQQKEAVYGIVNNSLFLLTGGPGTGKTFVLECAIFVLECLRPGIDIHLTAPTGKAAVRMTESTKRFARTIHSELKINTESMKHINFEGDVLIVDEISMLDMRTSYLLALSIYNLQHVIFVGDPDQLPSVDLGATIRDLIASDVIPYVGLTKTYRQANESALFCNIIKVKNGDPNLVSDKEEFEIFDVKDDCKKQLIDLYMKEVQTYGIENVVCLLPYRKSGELCSNKINKLIQAKVNPKAPGKPFMQTVVDGEPFIFNQNDIVMQLINRSECANGDVGTVIYASYSTLKVKYATGVIVRYTNKEASTQLTLAYSMSINKSQGSEYKSVVMGITTAHAQMLQRNLLYTGITRAKKRCVLVKEQKAIEIAVQNEAMYLTTLKQKDENDTETLVRLQRNGRISLFAEKLRMKDRIIKLHKAIENNVA